LKHYDLSKRRLLLVGTASWTVRRWRWRRSYS